MVATVLGYLDMLTWTCCLGMIEMLGLRREYFQVVRCHIRWETQLLKFENHWVGVLVFRYTLPFVVKGSLRMETGKIWATAHWLTLVAWTNGARIVSSQIKVLRFHFLHFLQSLRLQWSLSSLSSTRDNAWVLTRKVPACLHSDFSRGRSYSLRLFLGFLLEKITSPEARVMSLSVLVERIIGRA